MLTALLALPASAHAAEDPLCPTVVPGKSIGPLTVGMAPAALAKLKLPKDLYELYPITGGKPLDGMGLSLSKARCFVLGGKKISAKLSPEAIALKLGGCGPAEMRLGGNWLACQDGRMAVSWSMGGTYLRVLKGGEKVKETCDVYVAEGSHFATPAGELRAQKGPRALAIEKGKKYCWWGRVVTSAWTPEEIWKIPARSCGEQKKGGETILTCDYWGLRFFFKKTLSRVEVFPAKR